jgi:putative pyruvate formate lyase activating enzyme
MDRSRPAAACQDEDPRAAAYVALAGSGELQRRASAALAKLGHCELCPRRCGADRAADKRGFCGVGRLAVVADAAPHFGEERCLVGAAPGWTAAFVNRGGSGTVFFAGCNLGCTFCQNWEISHERRGREADAPGLAGLMLDLQQRGCLNINLVTPSHVVPQILEALVLASKGGLRLPIVYNSGGYDTVETLLLLDGVIDIYMPDFKFWSARSSAAYLGAADYPEKARAAIAEMHRQTGDLRLEDGIARRGLLVRHLVMPNATAETDSILAWLAALSPSTFVNVMAQYRPEGAARHDPTLAPAGGRGLGVDEYACALAAARELGLVRAARW